MTATYTVSYNCGHHSYVGEGVSSGMDWCPLCGRYVGVTILRNAAPVREDVSPAGGQGHR